MIPSVTVDICTKDRYFSTLPLTLQSIANQTYKPKKVIIYDDSSNPIDMRTNETFNYIFHLLDDKGIDLYVMYGEKKGQHFGHESIQNMAETPFIYRIDDDEIAEPETLENLMKWFTNDKVGAVGGLVLMPGAQTQPCLPNTIQNLNQNCQWYRWAGHNRQKDVEHLYSSYVYRKGLHPYELALSSVAHREETLHSFGIYKKGYRLIVNPEAITWHFRSSAGGIRTGQQGEYHNDEILFNAVLREYGIGCQPEKTFLIDEGKGDHVVFAKLVPEILQKYKAYKINFYVTYPELFVKYGIETKSIKQGLDEVGNKARFNLYEFMGKSGKKMTLEQAYREFYQI